MFKLQCPDCGKRIIVREESAGKKGKCPQCGKVLRIPKVVKRVEPESRVEPEPDFGWLQDEPERQVAPIPPIVVSETPLQSTPVISPVVYTPVQVNVTPSTMSHSLGIASLVIGILAFFVSWIPYIGVFFAGIGFVLGATGLVAAIVRKGSGVGYSIAGIAVSLVALVIGVMSTLALYAVFDRSMSYVDQLNMEAEADKNDSLWKDASLPQEVGNIRVSITKVVSGTVPLLMGRRESESEDESLTVWLKVENISERKKTDYRGWMGASSFSDIASLSDDVDNSYRPITFYGQTVRGATPGESIYPGKAIDDAVVFQLPVEGADFLRLKLTSNAFGEEGDVRFQIPASMIVKK